MYHTKFGDKYLDDLCLEITDKEPEKMISWLVMYEYGRQTFDEKILSDNYRNRLERKLLDVWDELESDQKDLLDISEDIHYNRYFKVTDFPRGVKYAYEGVKNVFR